MRSGWTRRAFLGSTATISTALGTTGTALSTSQSSPIQGDDEWTGFGFDAGNSGHNPAGTGPIEDVGGRWTVDAGGRITASPVVKDGVVYFGSQDGRIYGVDTGSGEELDNWPVNLESSISAAPIVADETVYVATQAGDVFALDTTTGEQQWQFGTGGAIEGPLNYANETVYLGNRQGDIYAINAADTDEQGTERWSIETDGGIESGPAVAAVDSDESPDQMLFIGDNDTTLAAIDAETGELEWTYEALGAVNSTPTVVDGTVYVGSLVAGDPAQGVVYAIDAVSGTREWFFDAGGAVVGSPAIADGTVYVGSRSNNIFAVDATDGSQEWRFDTGNVVTSSPAVVDSTVYVTSESNTVFGLSTDGEQLWEFRTSNSISASPAVANGVVYTGSDDATLYALEEGGDIEGVEPGSGQDVESGSSDTDGDSFAFLIVPASIGGFFAVLAGLIYAVIRSGVPERFAVDEAPIERLYDDEDDPIPDYDDRSQSEVWEMIVGDVISRAERSDKTASANVIVTKYVDDTLEAPVVAYEIESVRETTATIRMTEPLVGDSAALTDQPLNAGWTVTDDSLVFESVTEPGETIKTMIGRQDCPKENAENLLRTPEIAIESVASDTENSPPSETDQES